MLSIVTALVPLALAGTPHTVTLSSMTEQDGVAVLDQDLLSSAYETLITELGAGVAQPATHPARTLGAGEWEFTLSQQFLFIEARLRDGPSPWERSHPDEAPPNVLTIPTLEAHIGLPLSAEVSFRTGWIAGTDTGIVGGSARVAILEGYQPLPDFAVRFGYGGYVGNDELELGTTDISLLLGTTNEVGHRGTFTSARVSPWASYSWLTINAAPILDPQTASAIGAVSYRNDSEDITAPGPIKTTQVGAGVRVAARGVHITLGANWSPDALPAATAGMGLLF